MSVQTAAQAVAIGAQQHQQTYRPQSVGLGEPKADSTPVPGQSSGNSARDFYNSVAPSFGMPQPPPNSIQPPLGTGASGLQASNEVPPGYYPWNNILALNNLPPDPNAQSIFYNPSTNHAIEVTGGPSAVVDDGFGNISGGVPKFSSNDLAAGELKSLLGNATGGLGGGGGGAAEYVDHGPTQQQQIQNAMAFQQLLNQQKQQDLQNTLDQITAIRQQQALQMTAQNNANSQLQQAGPNLVGNAQYFGGWAPGGPGPALAAMNGLTMAPVPTAGHVVNMNINPNPPPPDPALAALLARLGG